MDDRELLERSAKAYKCDFLDWRNGSQCFYYTDPETGREMWNPLDDDAQAMRLAVKMHLTVRHFMGETVAQSTVPGGPSVYITETCHRLAIVKCAAEIQKAMP